MKTTTQFVVNVADEGALRVAPGEFRAGTGVLRQALPVAGGLIELNVAAPEVGICALIHDVDEAAWWTPFLFGDAVASALVELDESETDAGKGPIEVASEPGDPELVEAAQRLLYGYWLRRWLPSTAYPKPVEEWLLDCELGAIAARAEVLLAGDEVAYAFLDGNQRQLAEELTGALTAAQDSSLATAFGAGTVARVVQRAAFAAADVIEPDAPGFEQLATAVAAVREAFRTDTDENMVESVDPGFDAALPAASPDEELARALAELRKEDVALAADIQWSRGVEGSSPVDWTQTHPRQFATDGRAVSWAIEGDADGAAAVIVAVSAPSNEVSMPVEEGELYVSVRAAGEMYAAVFEYEEAGERFVARCPIASTDDLRVTVYSDVYGTGGRAMTSAKHAEEVRRTVTKVASYRQDAVRRGSPFVAPFAFERRALSAES